MNKYFIWLLMWVGSFFTTDTFAHINPKLTPKPNGTGHVNEVTFREDCTTPRKQIDQGLNRLTNERINNVRARLTTGGDVWWDRNDGKYIVPYVDPGEVEVSSLFAGGVWLGGFDGAGNLKLAAQTYGARQGNSDFFAGPLTPFVDVEHPGGETDAEICADWDRFFEVYRSEVLEHLDKLSKRDNDGIPYTPDQIPAGVKGWPARGNQYFLGITGFELPNTDQGLAGFYDANGDDLYEPLDGDFPIIEIRRCGDIDPKEMVPDQMIFWIYNDAGGVHGETQGDKIRMEVQVQAFSYGTNNAINDMTFQRYKLINRAQDYIDSTFFAFWVDPDLGCHKDDYVGSDTLRGLAITYNKDEVDGEPGSECEDNDGNQVPTYGTEIPIIATDYFQGPFKYVYDSDDNVIDSIELGMSSFTYYNNSGVGNPPGYSTDPNTAQEYYYYLEGYWRDGTPFTVGGDGHGGTEVTRYALSGNPDDGSGWSMCTAGLEPYDRRTIQASGPFRLKPGQINELIVGVVWVPDMPYPCPSIDRLIAADKLAQDLFDNCFDITDGPDAPDMDIIELDKELVLVLTNDTNRVNNNNAYEKYHERVVGVPQGYEDTLYNFEGYKIYQLKGPQVSKAQFNDPDKAKLIYEVDVKNGISKIYNWEPELNPVTGGIVYVPTEKVAGSDKGILHSFKVTTDPFAREGNALVNHKKYYFSVVAFAHNEWDPFTGSETDAGQELPYLEGRSNIKTYVGIPRPTIDKKLHAKALDGPAITRLDGHGVGSNIVDISDETRKTIENGFADGDFDGRVVYKNGFGPIKVKVFNPLTLTSGKFKLEFFDGNMDDDELDADARWRLTRLDEENPVIISEKTLEKLNEQTIAKYGFSIAVGQTDDVGDLKSGDNGYLGSSIQYLDPEKEAWMNGIPGKQWVVDIVADPDRFHYDPDGGLSRGIFVPYQLLDYRKFSQRSNITPALDGPFAKLPMAYEHLKELNNVDIVLTSNKDLWSRCVVVEEGNSDYVDLGFEIEGGKDKFDLRAAPSVDKNGQPDGSGTYGMGWFPGYAVNVENGQRVNIFFGENSVYDTTGAGFPSVFEETPTGRDMIFNPQAQIVSEIPGIDENTVFDLYGGGQHFIYVTDQAYDECEYIRSKLSFTSDNKKRLAIEKITWTGLILPAEGQKMLSVEDGLIPNDVTIKIRVDNPYGVEIGTNDNNGHPSYEFDFSEMGYEELAEDEVSSQLDEINVVPNPYYARSTYETNALDNVIKITNLPAKCVVTIYSLDGRFIKEYNRDEVGAVPSGNRAILQKQINPDLIWDLTNHKGVPVASGVYLIHVKAPGLGERTIKWFGVIREFDPKGL